MSLLSRMSCAQHGECVHLKGRCVHCHPVERRTPAQGSDVNTPIGAKRRERPKRMNRYGNPGRPAALDLTPSEVKTAALIAKGAKQCDIAVQLGLTRAAISSTVKRACERIGALHTYELIRYVRERGWA
jgi:DNA-binding NarL/FixJ family response regulator